MSKMIDLTGKQFGHLTALYSISGPRDRLWVCKCDCGKITHPIPSYRLRTGGTKSCGCERIRYFKRLSESKTKHGHGKELLMGVWYAMLSRCENPNDASFKNYGGRNIKVCDEWHDYMAFYNWAINNGYSQGLSLDRIDNNGDYSPENCKWSDRFEQNNNTRKNRLITIGEDTKTLAQWAREIGISWSTLRNRINRGVPPEDLKSPPKKKRRNPY